MEYYILDTKQICNYNALYKARKDITFILKKYGFQEKLIFVGNNKKRFIKEIVSQKKQIVKLMNSLTNGSVLAVQYPWNTMWYGIAKYIKLISKKKNILTIVIIHDVNSYRKVSKVAEWYYRIVVREICYLNSFDYIICHNEIMKNVLIKDGISESKIVTLDIFDYLYEQVENKCGCYDENEKNWFTINIAGNLAREKAGYIYKIKEVCSNGITVNLYGGNYDGETRQCLNYKGSFLPEELPNYLHEGFGLVWDGESTHTCSGTFGDYLRINNPHKLSLYIASGLPVIVWSESAVAKFVKDKNIGICVGSLEEIKEKLEGLSMSELKDMQKNVQYLRRSIVNGENIMRAMSYILENM